MCVCVCACHLGLPRVHVCQVDGNVDLEQVLSTWTKALTGMSALVVDDEGYFSWDSAQIPKSPWGEI